MKISEMGATGFARAFILSETLFPMASQPAIP
jgi:hypothetical protein